MDDYNERFTRVVENDSMSTEAKNLAIGMLTTLRAPMHRKVAAALRSHARNP
jgi:hypothetical protein